jgi:hypothetical protein
MYVSPTPQSYILSRCPNSLSFCVCNPSVCKPFFGGMKMGNSCPVVQKISFSGAGVGRSLKTPDGIEILFRERSLPTLPPQRPWAAEISRRHSRETRQHPVRSPIERSEIHPASRQIASGPSQLERQDQTRVVRPANRT